MSDSFDLNDLLEAPARDNYIKSVEQFVYLPEALVSPSTNKHTLHTEYGNATDGQIAIQGDVERCLSLYLLKFTRFPARMNNTLSSNMFASGAQWPHLTFAKVTFLLDFQKKPIIFIKNLKSSSPTVQNLVLSILPSLQN